MSESEQELNDLRQRNDVLTQDADRWRKIAAIHNANYEAAKSELARVKKLIEQKERK